MLNFDEILLEINNKRPNMPPLVIDSLLNLEAGRQAENVLDTGRFNIYGQYEDEAYLFGIGLYNYDGFVLYVSDDKLKEDFKYVGIGQAGGIYVVVLQKELDAKYSPEEESTAMSWLASLIKPVVDWFYRK